MSTIDSHKPFKIIIAGAGAAGYVAAAAIRRNCPYIDVTIIHDPVTPFIGIGETLSWNGNIFMKKILGLPNERQWLDESQSSYKLAVKHTGWTGNTDSLYSQLWWNGPTHFLYTSLVDIYKFSNTNKHILAGFDNKINKYSVWDIWLHLYKKGLVKKEDRAGHLAEAHWYTQFDTMPWNQFDVPLHQENTCHTYNINAEHFKEVVHKLVGEPNGVKIIPIKIVDTIINNGQIDSLLLEDGSIQRADIYIDCTGFKRLLIKKIDEFQWEPCDEYFNNASLFGQALYTDGQYYPEHNYVEFTAMQHGWVFTSPFNRRSGNGYQFNRNIVDNDDLIISDYEKRFPHKKNVITRKLTWDPGYYNKIFAGNCIALGISHGFADPYDANGFSSSLTYITKLLDFLKEDTAAEFAWKDKFNTITNSMVEDIKLRIQTSFHLAPKNDSEYWHEMKEAAKKYNTLARLKTEVFNPSRRNVFKKNTVFFGQGTLAHHALYYGIDFPIPKLPLDEHTEKLAIAFFNYFSEHNRINAQFAQPREEFYKKFYNK